jgi:predicted amidohydrolase
MFDVTLSETESYKESAGYRPGTKAVITNMPFGKLGMTICYDLRFPHLFRSLAEAGAGLITVPSAFATATGAAHWVPLLRARAIENGVFILAPAQTGTHKAQSGKPRKTYGHSMIISPWGESLADGGEGTGIVYADLDLSEIVKARQRVPSLTHTRPYKL